MKANELMIGDWVQILAPSKYQGARGRIKTLIDHKDDETAYFKVFLQNNPIWVGIEDVCSDDISPIPLTAEILEMNKIPKSRLMGEQRHFFYNLDSDLELLAIYDASFSLQIGNSARYVNYVHELQHILRLCRINKEIVL